MINQGLWLAMCILWGGILREAIVVYRDEKKMDARQILFWSGSLACGAVVAFFQKWLLHLEKLTRRWHIISDSMLDGFMLLAIYFGLATTIELSESPEIPTLKRSLEWKLFPCWLCMIGFYPPYHLGYGDRFLYLHNGVQLVVFFLFIRPTIRWCKREAESTTNFVLKQRYRLMRYGSICCMLYPLASFPNPERFEPRPDLIIIVMAAGFFYLGYVMPGWLAAYLRWYHRSLTEIEAHPHLALVGVIADLYGQIARNRYALEHWIRRFARRIRLPRRKTERIVRASYLLDVGQVPYLPVSSDGTEPPESASYSLSDEALEQVSVRWRSADFVRELLGFVEIERILRHVHERWDGSGFPDGLRGQEIPLESRVLHLMDEFVSAWYLERDELSALSEIQGRRGEFDPKLVRALEGMVGDGR